MTFTHALATNNYGPAKFIVSSSVANGTHTTIASAITSASDGDTIFIRPGDYTENLTLKSGVSFAAYDSTSLGAGSTNGVKIIGKMTATDAGSYAFSGISLQTNADNFITVTGANSLKVDFNNCELNVVNATGINLNNANASINISNCKGYNLTNANAFFNVQAGTLQIEYLFHQTNNIGTSLISGGTVRIDYSTLTFSITTSSSGVLNMRNCFMDIGTVCITHGATSGTSEASLCNFEGGSSTAITISAGATFGVYNCIVGSSTTNAIAGAGTLNYSNITFNDTSSLISTTTQNGNYNQLGKWKASSQPSFLAIAALQSNVTGDGTVYTNQFTEIFDQNNNFNGTTTFTAPVTGRYQLNCNVQLGDLGAANTSGAVVISTSNRNYQIISNNWANIRNNLNFAIVSGSVLSDMDAGDTATVTTQINSGTKIVDIIATNSWFSGQLIA